MVAAALVVASSVTAPAASAQDAPTCGTIPTTINAPATNGSTTDADPSDCYALQGVTAGEPVAVRVTATRGQMQLRWTVSDGNGNAVCDGSWLYESDGCVLSGEPGWTLTVGEQYEADWAGTTSFLATVRRTTSSEGCGSLNTPASLSFTAPRTNGSIGSAMGASCYAFTRLVNDPDEAWWIRTDRTSGTLQLRWRVFGPSGMVECSGSGLDFARCELRAAGSHILVVDDSYGAGTGSFLAAATRTSARTGCTGIASTDFDATATSGNITAAGEVDCHSLTDVASGDRLRLGIDSSEVQWTVVDGTGNAICYSDWQRWKSCSLSGAEGWAVLVHNPSGGSGNAYGLAVRSLTAPAGCSGLGSPSTWTFTRPRTNGSLSGGLAPRCYTFERGGADADDAAWISTERTSGNLAPTWRVYDPQGDEVCSGDWGDGYHLCDLRSAGKHSLVVEDRNAANGGSFYLTAYRVTARSGCSPMASTAFGTDPFSGAIGAGGEVDCLDSAGLTEGDAVEVRVTEGSWQLVDGTGQPVCGSSGRAECSVSGVTGWSLLVYDDGGAQTFTYSAAIRRLNDPDGCSSLGAPEAWSFTSGRLTGSIAGPSRPRCYTFDRALEDGDETYLFRAIRTSGTLSPVWRLYGPGGGLECSNDYYWARLCELREAGAHTVVVDDTAGSGTGGFVVSADRVTAPAGCAEIRSVTQGVPKSVGRLAAMGEVDCFVVPAATDDQFTFETSGSADRLTLVGANGQIACEGWGEFGCTTGGDGPYLALIESTSGTETGNYSFEATCDNVPCGVADTAILDVTPSTVGAGSQASVLLRGRDLDLLESVEFVRGETELVGELQEPAPDGRTRMVQFSTGAAATGAYRLVGAFIDGSTRELADALTVATAQPAHVRLSLVGREAFRVGVSTTVTVQATNSGNVDARGVNMIIGGFPAGSTVTPVGGVTEISGTGDAPQFRKRPFDQETGSETTEEGIVAPFFISRVPASSSVQIKFDVTVPTNTSYRLRVRGGECIDQPVPTSAAARRATAGEDCAYGLIQAAADIGDEVLPGPACEEFIRDGMMDGIYAAGPGELLTWENAGTFFFSGGKCAADVWPAAKVVEFGKGLLKVGSRLWDRAQAALTGYKCGQALAESELPQQAVVAIDPNDIIGPAGAGDNRYITGDGDQLYQVLFENLPAATAPAQRVVVTNQLDTTRFDSATVRFRSVQFGDTIVPLPTPVAEIDETVDLRPANNLLVHVTSSVTPAGRIEWTLQAIDPDTLAPPEDPISGFLPPNDATHRGEGALNYTVRLKELAEGTAVTNQASIVFDANEAIETPTWSNVIDRSPPSVGLTASTGADPGLASIAWTGTDAASGVSRWDITVSKDGGTPTLWHSSDSPGSKQFSASEPGTYAFRAIAHDGATNSTQSPQTAVVLTASGSQPATPTPPSPPQQGDEASGAPPAGGVPPTNPSPPGGSPPGIAPRTAPVPSAACRLQQKKRTILTKRIAKTKKLLKKARGAKRRRLTKRRRRDTKTLTKVRARIRTTC